MCFVATIYSTKYLKSSTFAIISRTKVFVTLVMISMFNSDVIDVKLIIYAAASFLGVMLVVDPTIFGLGDADPAKGGNLPAEYYKKQALGVLFCFVYVIANSISKVFETIYSRPESRSHQHEPSSILPIRRDVGPLHFQSLAHG